MAADTTMRPHATAVSRRRQAFRRAWDQLLPPLVWCASLVIFVGIWHVASTFHPPALLPSPKGTFNTLLEVANSGLLARHAGASLSRVLSGFLLGAAVGMGLGLAAGCIHLVRIALDPYVNFLRFVPAVALLTPFVVWFGIGETSKIALLIFATLFIVMLNTVAGVDDLPTNRVRAARMLGAGPWQLFALIVFPSTLPYIIVGMRIAMGVSFAAIIVAEMVSADTGLGYLLSYARVVSATDLQFITIACLGALGWATDKVFQIVSNALLRRYA